MVMLVYQRVRGSLGSGVAFSVSGRVESRLDQDSISGTENFVGMLPAINRLEGFVARFAGRSHEVTIRGAIRKE